MRSMQMGLATAMSLSLATPAGARDNWVAAWASSPMGIPDQETIELLKTRPDYSVAEPILAQGTIRYRVRIAKGGDVVRLTFANRDDQTVFLDRATVAVASAEGHDAEPGSIKSLHFAGAEGIRIAPGAPVVSDPLPFHVADGADLLVSIHVPAGVRAWSLFVVSAQEGPWFAKGDQTQAEAVAGATPLSSRPLLSRIDVLSPETRGVVVAFGDSITDGKTAPDGDRGWPGVLAHRLAARGLSVVNAGIAGNRLLLPAGAMQPSGLARMDMDVLAVPGITHIILLAGVNDIASAGKTLPFFGASPPLSAEELIAAYRQVIVRAHQRGVKILGGTILPFGGNASFSPEKEALRQSVNMWIRTSGAFDGVIDFEAMLRDPAAPDHIGADYHSGDHLHPNIAGFRLMGEQIDLSLFP